MENLNFFLKLLLKAKEFYVTMNFVRKMVACIMSKDFARGKSGLHRAMMLADVK